MPLGNNIAEMPECDDGFGPAWKRIVFAKIVVNGAPVAGAAQLFHVVPVNKICIHPACYGIVLVSALV